jgi:ethanolamine-phosphate cytidylyltransferase
MTEIMDSPNTTGILIDDYNIPTLFTRYTGLNTSLIANIVMSSDNILEDFSNSVPISITVTHINTFLSQTGVPKQSLLTTDEFVLACVTFIITLVMYYILMGKGHSKKRRRLAADLKIAQDKVHFLEEKLMLFEDDGDAHEGEEIRIFMDGAFDMMHYGHMNAFRLARSLGSHLVVGVNSDKSITECKGAPLMNDDERLTMVKGCKFVDEVVPDCPYVMSETYLNWVMKTYKIDYVIHGDDPCIVNGKDVYESAKKAGKFQSIPRTEGKKEESCCNAGFLMNLG